jgi:acetyl-CoA C-acetyltransferase
MGLDPRTPVIIGVGQRNQRTHHLTDALDPIQLIAQAARAAAVDTGAATDPLASLDAVRIVRFLTARHTNPAFDLAQELMVTAHEYAITSNGGNSPQSLMNLTCRQIEAGQLDLALLGGGECNRTKVLARRTGAELGWGHDAPGIEPPVKLLDELAMSHPYEISLKIYSPIQVYPMNEQALRHAEGETVAEHQVKISELWGRFAAVAADNPYAAVRTHPTAEEIRTVTHTNRMIGFPYPKMMNSNDRVDQSAVLLVASVAKAEALGVPRERWVFPWAGTDAHDSNFMSHRWDFASSPGMRTAGRGVLELARVGADDLAFVDLYSCFPSAVQIAAKELGLSLDRPLTITGGLPFAGGPWNNYVTHSIATAVDRCRNSPGSIGLISANGGFVTKHAFGVYSSEPSPHGAFRYAHPQATIDASPTRQLAEHYAGPATVETYTVMHSATGEPERVVAACLTPDGSRTWGTSSDELFARHMVDTDQMMAACTVEADSTLHLAD